MAEFDVEQTMHITPDDPGGPIANAAVAGETKEGETPERPRSAREDAMLRIAERRNEALAKELAYGDDIGLPKAEREDAPAPRQEEGDPDSPPLSPAAKTPAPPPQAQPAPAAPQPQLLPFDPGNGSTIWVTPDQLVQLARDGATARLAVHQYQQQPQQQPQQPPPQQQQNPQSQRQPALEAERTAEYFRRLTFGDAEEGGRALQEFAGDLLDRSRQMSPDPRAIASYATQQAIQAINLERNLQTLAREYTDIFEDRALSQLAAIKVGEFRQHYAMTGTQRSDLDLYRDACATVRRAVRGVDQPQPASEAASSESATQAAPLAVADTTRKLERKRAAPQQPQAVSRVASDGAGKPWEGNRSAVVDRMRALRGQQSMR